MFVFLEGAPTPGLRSEYEPALFNTPEYLALRDPDNVVSFSLLDEDKGKCVAGIRFHVQGSSARSPLRAPFGSVEFSPRVSPADLYGFLENVEASLKEKGVKEIIVKNPPHVYAPEQCSLVEAALLNRGYAVADAEITATVPVGASSLMEVVRNSERLRKHQSGRAGLTFENPPSADAGVVFDFISSCHREKGYRISISREELLRAIGALPGRYHLFVVADSEIRAAAVCIRVRKNILYNFLLNHEKAYNQLSPAVLLIEGIYEFCRENDIGVLDLGTSALGGQPNFSLLDFKLRMGGIPSSKLSFLKSLN